MIWTKHSDKKTEYSSILVDFICFISTCLTFLLIRFTEEDNLNSNLFLTNGLNLLPLKVDLSEVHCQQFLTFNLSTRPIRPSNTTWSIKMQKLRIYFVFIVCHLSLKAIKYGENYNFFNKTITCKFENLKILKIECLYICSNDKYILIFRTPFIIKSNHMTKIGSHPSKYFSLLTLGSNDNK